MLLNRIGKIMHNTVCVSNCMLGYFVWNKTPDPFSLNFSIAVCEKKTLEGNSGKKEKDEC